jgi:hypothetical protein
MNIYRYFFESNYLTMPINVKKFNQQFLGANTIITKIRYSTNQPRVLVGFFLHKKVAIGINQT